jgi:hypothetical protein
LPPFAQQFVTLTKQEPIELVCQARTWKSLQDRAVKRELKRLEKLRDQTELADRCEAALRAELEVERARVRDLKQRLYGHKRERRRRSETLPRSVASARRRGRQCGAKGHGRKRAADLEAIKEEVGMDDPRCPSCGAALEDFPGTEDREALEIEVSAHCRLIQRRRYRCPASAPRHRH